MVYTSFLPVITVGDCTFNFYWKTPFCLTLLSTDHDWKQRLRSLVCLRTCSNALSTGGRKVRTQIACCSFLFLDLLN